MFTVIGIIASFVILKFVHDTYLTNNTERRFEEYRQKDPIGAAEIEPPTNQRNFDELIEAVAEKVTYEQNLQIRQIFPEFAKQYDNRLIQLESSEQILSYLFTTNQADAVISVFRAHDLVFYFSGFLTKEDGTRVDGTRIRLGNINEIKNVNIDWRNIVTDFLEDLARRENLK